MSSHHGIFTFALFVSVALALIATSEAANLTVGLKGPRDHLAQREFFKKGSKMFKILSVDKTFNTATGETISQVRLLDENKKRKGATATIIAGGPGFKFVTVHFKSKRGQSIDFIVELYGQ